MPFTIAKKLKKHLGNKARRYVQNLYLADLKQLMNEIKISK